MKSFFSICLCFSLIAAHGQEAPPFWDDIQSFKKSDAGNPPPAASILFVGSSSFALWKDMKDYFPGYPVVNRGFGGSTLVDVIRYTYDIIIPYKPRQVVIYCGENDCASSETITATEVAIRFKTLFGMIRANLPNATIDYISMKPSPSRVAIQDRIRAANKEIKTFLSRQKNAHYIDVYQSMLDPSGRMRPEIYLEDQLHMNPQGYAIWQRIIAPYLKR